MTSQLSIRGQGASWPFRLAGKTHLQGRGVGRGRPWNGPSCGLGHFLSSCSAVCAEPPGTSMGVLPSGSQASLVPLLPHSAHTEKTTMGPHTRPLGTVQKEQRPQCQAGLSDTLADIQE